MKKGTLERINQLVLIVGLGLLATSVGFCDSPIPNKPLDKIEASGTTVTASQLPEQGKEISDNVTSTSFDAELNKRGIYPLAGQVLIDRNLVIKNAAISSTTITNATITTLVSPVVPTVTNPAAYSPTVAGAGTVTNNNFWWQQVGKYIHIWGAFQAGTAAASQASITVPSGKVIDTSKVVSGSPLGFCYDLETGSVNALVTSFAFSDASDTSKIFFAKSVTSGSLPTAANGNSIWGSNVYITFDLFVPVTS